MKKIKSVKLKRDYSTPEKWIFSGTELKKYDEQNFVHDGFYFHIDRIKNYPEFFDITYENDFFEVKPLGEGEHLHTNGNVYHEVSFAFTKPCNRFATIQEAEFENMRRETLHYFRELAKELNEGWEWKESETFQGLILNKIEKELMLYWFANSAHPVVKFSPSLTTEQITERALPSMVENFINICKSQY